jgi:hypothetical protein
MSTEGNRGIIVTGQGQLHADAVAAGDHAQAIVNKAHGDIAAAHGEDLAQKLDELMAALRAHSAELEAPEEVLESTAKLAEELKAEKPNKLTVNAILGGIVSAAQSVGAVAQAAGALVPLVALL